MDDGAPAVAAVESRYASRKFRLAVGLVLLATLLLAVGLIDKALWWSVIQLAGGGYFLVNVGQKAVEALLPPKA